jgi:hypothetical protein
MPIPEDEAPNGQLLSANKPLPSVLLVVSAASLQTFTVPYLFASSLSIYYVNLPLSQDVVPVCVLSYSTQLRRPYLDNNETNLRFFFYQTVKNRVVLNLEHWCSSGSLDLEGRFRHFSRLFWNLTVPQKIRLRGTVSYILTSVTHLASLG